MILCGTTPRALSWRGLLVVVALGSLLLPALPMWAQPGASPLRKGEDEDKKNEDIKAAEAELQRARAALKQAEDELRDKTDQVRAAQEKVRASHARVQQLSGSPQPTEERRVIILRMEKDGKQEDGVIALPARVDAQLLDELRRLLTKAKEDPKDIDQAIELLNRIRDPKPVTPVYPRPPVPAVVPNIPLPPARGVGRPPIPTPPGGVDPRLQNLERRLDEMMRELQRLRQEIRPGERGANDAPLLVPPGRPEADPEHRKATIYKLSNVIRRGSPDGTPEYGVVPAPK
jgi:hypothetical protein